MKITTALLLAFAFSLSIAQAQVGSNINTAPYCPIIAVTLGSSGNNVRNLQQFLIANGFSIPAGATGNYSTQTAAAVNSFQTSQGIPVGPIDSVTLTIMNQIACQYAPQNSGNTGNTSNTGNNPTPNPTSSTIVVTFSTDPTSITASRPVVLSWSSTNANTCYGDSWSTGASAPTSGSVSVAPTKTTTYTVTCRNNANGQSVSKSATVSFGANSQPNNNPPTPTTQSSSNQFSAGDKIKTTSDGVNVRDNPTVYANSLGTVSANLTGYIVSGPAKNNNYTWWNVRFDSGKSGWVAENYLTAVVDTHPANPLSGSSKIDLKVNGQDNLSNLPPSDSLTLSWTATPEISACYIKLPSLSGGSYQAGVTAQYNRSMTAKPGQDFYPAKGSTGTYTISCDKYDSTGHLIPNAAVSDTATVSLDPTPFAFTAPAAGTVFHKGDTVTVTWTGADYGVQEYYGVIDTGGNVLAHDSTWIVGTLSYGHISAGSHSASFTIPSWFSEGTSFHVSFGNAYPNGVGGIAAHAGPMFSISGTATIPPIPPTTPPITPPIIPPTTPPITPPTTPPTTSSPTVHLFANPSSISTSGGTVVLSWNASNITYCSNPLGRGFLPDAGDANHAINKFGTSATISSPSRTFYISCTGTNGTVVSDSVTVNVGTAVTQQSCTDLTSQTVACPSGQSGTIVQTRTVSPYPACSLGSWVTASNSCVTPSSAPTVSLSASPGTINAGQSTTLYWSSTNATSCTTPIGSSISGQGTVFPTQTITYSITCMNGAGSASANTTVNVVSPPPPPPPTDNPADQNPSDENPEDTTIFRTSFNYSATNLLGGAFQAVKNLLGW